MLAASDAVVRVHRVAGAQVVLGDYSQAGMFGYQVTALWRGKHIDSLVTFSSPADIAANLLAPLSPEVIARIARGLVGTGLLQRGNLPFWAEQAGLNMIAPTNNLQSRARFLLALHGRDALLPRERQRRFLESEGFTWWACPAIAELLEQYVAHNRMIDGGFVIDDWLVRDCPVNGTSLCQVDHQGRGRFSAAGPEVTCPKCWLKERKLAALDD